MPSIQSITRCLALFHELYPTRELTEFTAEAWAIALADLGDPAFEWAVDRLLKEPGRQFFPTPNEVRVYLGPRRVLALPQGRDSPENAVEQFYAEQSKTSRRIVAPHEVES